MFYNCSLTAKVSRTTLTMVIVGDTTVIQGSRGAFVNREALEHQMVAMWMPQVYVAFRAHLSRATRRLRRL